MAPHLDFTSYLQRNFHLQTATPSNSFMQFLPVRKQAVSPNDLEQKILETQRT
jgi:hypothetical protein